MRLSQKTNSEVPAYTGEGVWPTQIVRGDAYYNKLQEVNGRAWYVKWSKLQNDILEFRVMWKDRSGKTACEKFNAKGGNYSRGWDLSEACFYGHH